MSERLNIMYWLEIRLEDNHFYEGYEIPFPSEIAYEAAQDWYNSNSKKDVIEYCDAKNVSLTIQDEPNKLIECWPDIAMAVFSWKQEDPRANYAECRMIALLRLLAREIAQ